MKKQKHAFFGDEKAEREWRKRDNYMLAIARAYREVLAWDNEEFSATACAYLADKKFRTELGQIARIGDYGNIDLDAFSRGALALAEALKGFEP